MGSSIDSRVVGLINKMAMLQHLVCIALCFALGEAFPMPGQDSAVKTGIMEIAESSSKMADEAAKLQGLYKINSRETESEQVQKAEKAKVEAKETETVQQKLNEQIDAVTKEVIESKVKAEKDVADAQREVTVKVEKEKVQIEEQVAAKEQGAKAAGADSDAKVMAVKKAKIEGQVKEIQEGAKKKEEAVKDEVVAVAELSAVKAKKD